MSAGGSEKSDVQFKNIDSPGFNTFCVEDITGFASGIAEDKVIQYLCNWLLLKEVRVLT